MTSPAPPVPVRAAGQPRAVWMDHLRGAAVLLVVVWHAPAVPALFGMPMPGWLRELNMFFLPFRMPTLMFLSGLLLPASLNKPLPIYYLGKLTALAWPYAVWVLVDRALLGSPHPVWHWRAWYATSYLWFLFFIGVYFAVAPLVRRLPAWLPALGAAVVSFLLPPGMESRLTYFAVFFFLGHLLARRPETLARLTRGWVLLPMGLVSMGYGVASSIWTLQLAYRVELAPLSIAGICCAVAGARALTARGMLPDWLATTGRNSIVLYTVHFPVMVVVVDATAALGGVPYPVLVLGDLAVALLVGALCIRLRDRPPVGWLFAAPVRPTRWLRGRLSPAPVPTPARDPRLSELSAQAGVTTPASTTDRSVQTAEVPRG